MSAYVLLGGHRGGVALVDRDDFARVMEHGWHMAEDGYVRGDAGGAPARLHRFILGLKPCDPEVDHINRVRYDCQKANLRLATRQRNARNRAGVRNSSSQFKGVYWHKVTRKWMSRITVDDKRTYLGLFASEAAAAHAYDAAARAISLDFLLNFREPEEKPA